MEINKELVSLKKDIDTVSKIATGLKITDGKSMEVASEILSRVNKYADSVEEKKQEVMAPLNLAVKNFRAMFKPLETQCLEVIESIRGKMTKYQTEQVARERAEEAKIVEKMNAGKIGIDKAVAKLEDIDRADKKVEVDSGSVSFIETPCFEVMDVVMLAEKTGDKYILADEVKIRAAMKAGIELPGVRYWKEMRPRNSR